MRAAHSGEQQFRQFLAVKFGRIFFRLEITQGFPNHFVSVGVAAVLDLFSNEIFEFFSQRHLHESIIARTSQPVNAGRTALILA